MSWERLYDERRADAGEALGLLRPGQHVFAATGQRVGELLARLPSLGVPLRVSAGADDVAWYEPDAAGHVRLTTHGGNGELTDAVPSWVWGANKAWADERDGAAPPDVSLVRVSRPNQHGYVCFGNVLWDAKTVAKRTTTTIALVAGDLPHTFGDTWMHVSDVDCFVEATEAVAPAAAAPADATIAAHLASLVRDGDTVHVGAGPVTAGLVLAGALNGRSDLGWFGEQGVPGSVGLVRNGVVTGRRMTAHPGKFVTTAAGHDGADVEFVHDNSMFQFYGTDYLHSPATIARNENMVAVNGARAVDLAGQVAGDGGTGHLAFHLGAFMSRGGRAVTVVEGTGIVARLPEGTRATVPHELADVVVTEFGVAHLLGRTLRERADALIAVAHPDERTRLRRLAGRV